MSYHIQCVWYKTFTFVSSNNFYNFMKSFPKNFISIRVSISRGVIEVILESFTLRKAVFYYMFFAQHSLNVNKTAKIYI